MKMTFYIDNKVDGKKELTHEERNRDCWTIRKPMKTCFTANLLNLVSFRRCPEYPTPLKFPMKTGKRLGKSLNGKYQIQNINLKDDVYDSLFGWRAFI